ncbi:receptor-like protein kinase [Striga asiatica]|uniref:non-specific serine/threonine protein kinase n=1 Tax=Striga asiatica TaxID=4170 RepID=A0A5A7P947_STRAF|nr:receptor-like protein kinase [Striga asiatica]
MQELRNSLVYLSLIIITIFLLPSAQAAALQPKPQLHQDEVKALKEIGRRLGHDAWARTRDPCSEEEISRAPVARKGMETSVACDCTFNNGSTCHIVSIAFKGQNLTGSVPQEFAKFRQLKNLDLSRNFLNGTIPPQWAKMVLVELSFMGNNLSGPFPMVITRLTTLVNLSLEGNRFSGPIPSEIGRLVNLRKLVLSSNTFTGDLPVGLARLTSLIDMRISDNNFRGRIPDFIGSWRQIEKLHIQGCSLRGPIPSSISSLTSLLDLRISDLTGGGSPFPVLSDMKSIKVMDLSFNNLTGEIPDSFAHLTRVDFLYLTRNRLTGQIPSWILERNKNAGRVHSCMKQDFPCPNPRTQQHYSLHINCGGEEVNITNDSKYEADTESRGASMYYASQNWAFSSTGNFMDNDIDSDNYRTTNTSSLHNATPIVKNFTVAVTGHTLKIHLYWAGKGTTGIPERGTYGPIAMVGGIVAGGFCFLTLVLAFLRKRGYLGGKTSTDKELRGLDLQTGMFTLRQIKAATKNFDPANKIGEGGFGSVYKGLLLDGTIIAVKQLSSKSKQGTREFVNEIGMVSALQHPNLVKLYGCCVEGNQLLLIYEYMENNCISRALFGKSPIQKLKLDWPTRRKICLGIARGLAYLHEESSVKIVHRDIKTSNVLLDKDLNAKISDFGLAKLNEDDNTHISTRIAGTIGKSNTNYRPKEDFVYLLDWAYVLQERGSLLELVDPELGSAYSSEEAMVVLNVALLCTNAAPTLRPIMSQVVSMLEGHTEIQDLLSDPGFSTLNSKYKAIRNHFWQQPSATHSMSVNSLCSDSTRSEEK